MTKMSLELQVGFEPTPCRLQVGCSTTEATAACCRSFPAVRETSNVCVVKGTNAFAVQNGFPARRFVHLLDATSIADAFSKIAQFFSNFALCLGNAVQ